MLRRGLGTVGQVGRSRNTQTADKRASGDYVTLGGRKSVLLLLSLLPSTPPPPLSNLPLSPPPSPPSPPSCTFTNDRLLTSKPRTVYKQILPPFQTTFTIVTPQSGPGSTWSKVRSTEAWRQCRCSWWNSPSRLHCAKLQGARKRRAKENGSRLNASLRNCPTLLPPATLPSSHHV